MKNPRQAVREGLGWLIAQRVTARAVALTSVLAAAVAR